MDLLASVDLFLPSTFEEFQWGDIATWSHPGGGSTSRLDYVAIPSHWRQAVISTWVDAAITSGAAVPDHSCTSVFLTWTQAQMLQRSGTRSFDQDAIHRPESKPVLQEIIESVPNVPGRSMRLFIQPALAVIFENHCVRPSRAKSALDRTRWLVQKPGSCAF